jgi:hypothetical protein
MTQPEFSEEELRALEAEMERISVDDVLIQTTVTLLNLAARKAGLAAPPGQGPAPDWEQTHTAIEAVRALLPIVEPEHGEALAPVRDALSRLQMAYVQLTGGQAQTAPEQKPPEGGQGEQGGPGPAQQSGRLWVPGQ